MLLFGTESEERKADEQGEGTTSGSLQRNTHNILERVVHLYIYIYTLIAAVYLVILDTLGLSVHLQPLLLPRMTRWALFFVHVGTWIG